MVTVGDRVLFKMRGRVTGFDPDCKDLCEIEVICEAFPNEVSWRVWREPKSVEVIERFKPPLFERKEPPDKPPAVGDWVVFTTWPNRKPFKILGTKIQCGTKTYELSDDGWTQSPHLMRIVRLHGAPLQKGDRGLLDGKIEVWVSDADSKDGLIYFVFRSEDIGADCEFGVEMVYTRPDRFTLTEPRWRPDEEV